MGKKTVFLLAVAALLLLPLQARAQDSPQRSVDLTTRMARTTHDGLRKAKNQPSKIVDAAAQRTDAATVPTTPADKKRAAVVKTEAQAAHAASKVKDKRETAAKRTAITREGPSSPIEAYPYLNAFQTEEEQGAFTIIDANEDTYTWDYAYNSDDNWFARYTYSDSFDADDWLVSPAFHFEAGKQYTLTFDTWNKGFDERIEVLAGSDATPEAMTIQVVEPTDVTWEEPQQLEATIIVSETGTYYIGFHAISPADMNKLFVDNVMVDVYELEAPAAPTGLTAVQKRRALDGQSGQGGTRARRPGDPHLRGRGPRRSAHLGGQWRRHDLGHAPVLCRGL